MSSILDEAEPLPGSKALTVGVRSVPFRRGKPKRISISHINPKSFAEGVRDLDSTNSSRRLVFLLHGIESRGKGLNNNVSRIRNSIEDHNITFDLLRYDPCGRVRAFLYAWLGWKPKTIQRLERDIQARMEEHDVIRVSIIAHSFGTYLVTQLLDDLPDLKLHHLILCGSVVDENYDWCKWRGRFSSITNDCGLDDCVPIKARWSRFFGRSGRIGFKSACVRNRYFKDMDHSDFFIDKFPIEYWSEIIVNDTFLVPPKGEGYGDV